MCDPFANYSERMSDRIVSFSPARSPSTVSPIGHRFESALPGSAVSPSNLNAKGADVVIVRDALRALSRIRLNRNFRTAVVGAGIGGIAMGNALKQVGCADFTIYEKAASLGGTWRDNCYPGVACDIPSHLYSFSFAPNPEWSRSCAPGAEICDYITDVARRWGLLEHMRFGKEVVQSYYRHGEWHLEFADGARTTVDVLISCTGILHVPRVPQFHGLEEFAGEVFHSARWPRGLDPKGKRVASVGSGSSSTQIVPALIGQVRQLKLFQRTAQWVFPLERALYSEHDKQKLRSTPQLLGQLYDQIMAAFEDKLGSLMTNDPQTVREFRQACEANLAKVADEELRRRLTPDYSVNCKRLVMSDSFYEAVQSEKFELVTSAIERFEARGIRTADGVLHEADIVVLATGFKSDQYCRALHPRGENDYTLEEAWSHGVTSFETVTLAGFPNFFMIGGPTSSVTSVSYITGAELQASYVVRALKLIEDANATAIAPTEVAQAKYVAANRKLSQGTVFMSGCKSWYLDEKGNFQFYAGHPREYVEMLAKGPRLADYQLLGAAKSPRSVRQRIH
jgi:cation diffusion facilitator CzcD-associated flavoprotein CzcO